MTTQSKSFRLCPVEVQEQKLKVCDSLHHLIDGLSSEFSKRKTSKKTKVVLKKLKQILNSFQKVSLDQNANATIHKISQKIRHLTTIESLTDREKSLFRAASNEIALIGLTASSESSVSCSHSPRTPQTSPSMERCVTPNMGSFLTEGIHYPLVTVSRSPISVRPIHNGAAQPGIMCNVCQKIIPLDKISIHKCDRTHSPSSSKETIVILLKQLKTRYSQIVEQSERLEKLIISSKFIEILQHPNEDGASSSSPNSSNSFSVSAPSTPLHSFQKFVSFESFSRSASRKVISAFAQKETGNIVEFDTHDPFATVPRQETRFFLSNPRASFLERSMFFFQLEAELIQCFVVVAEVALRGDLERIEHAYVFCSIVVEHLAHFGIDELTNDMDPLQNSGQKPIFSTFNNILIPSPFIFRTTLINLKRLNDAIEDLFYQMQSKRFGKQVFDVSALRSKDTDGADDVLRMVLDGEKEFQLTSSPFSVVFLSPSRAEIHDILVQKEKEHFVHTRSARQYLSTQKADAVELQPESATKESPIPTSAALSGLRLSVTTITSPGSPRSPSPQSSSTAFHPIMITPQGSPKTFSEMLQEKIINISAPMKAPPRAAPVEGGSQIDFSASLQRYSDSSEELQDTRRPPPPTKTVSSITRLIREPEHTFLSSLTKTQNITYDEVSGSDVTATSFQERITDGSLRPRLRDFELLQSIAEGAFGKVFKVRYIPTSLVFALKILSKSEVIRKNSVDSLIKERDIMLKARSTFIERFYCSFSTPTHYIMVLEYFPHGDLRRIMDIAGGFEDHLICQFARDITRALEYIHGFGVTHHDLKPSNILIGKERLKLIDFGLSSIGLLEKVRCQGSGVERRFKLCKIAEDAGPDSSDEESGETSKTSTGFVGTPGYIAPEIILGDPVDLISDWFSLGIILFEMKFGYAPFTCSDVQRTFRRIVSEELVFPDTIDADLTDLIRGLTCKNPRLRLGYNGAVEVFAHPFFKKFPDTAESRWRPPDAALAPDGCGDRNWWVPFVSQAPLTHDGSASDPSFPTVRFTFLGSDWEKINALMHV
eukprot:gnl/Chilomastix_cuspidata/5276.p1 GENE.gnl/Chilomastix_cuspidata/5276~~gnl/Chilomastix_cuspidata/5276.p1  ORF type:complete len:1054 (-),score=94.25 gnl/Chilomastix_cuspidata/5276:59-3220(-)